MIKDFLKEETERDERYLEFIRHQPCCVCGRAVTKNHPHHAGSRGVSTKSSDYEAVPMCALHHTIGTLSVHKMGVDSFQGYHGVDFQKIIIQNLIEYIGELYEKRD